MKGFGIGRMGEAGSACVSGQISTSPLSERQNQGSSVRSPRSQQYIFLVAQWRAFLRHVLVTPT